MSAAAPIRMGKWWPGSLTAGVSGRWGWPGRGPLYERVTTGLGSSYCQPAQRGVARGSPAGKGGSMVRKLMAELLGTGLLVFFGVGVATLMFGFGFDGGSVAAGVVATALAFGLVLLALGYAIGPLTGCHVNPAVTLGALLADRISPREAVGYWAAQFVGGILGALLPWGMFNTSPLYRTAKT